MPKKLILRISILLLVFLFFFSLSVLAETKEIVSKGSEQQIAAQAPNDWLVEYDEPAVSQTKKSLGSVVFSFLWKFSLVLLFLFITVRALKALHNKRIILPESEQNFVIIDSFYIKPNQALYLMKIAGKYMVLGVTNQAFSVITEIEDESQIESLGFTSVKSLGGNMFKGKLSSIMGLNSDTIDDKVSKSSEKILDQINKISKG